MHPHSVLSKRTPTETLRTLYGDTQTHTHMGVRLMICFHSSRPSLSSEISSFRAPHLPLPLPKKAGEIFEDEHKDDGDDNSITDWLNDIKAKDEQLRKVQQDQARSAGGGGAPPVRNAGNKKTKNIQVMPCTPHLEIAEKKTSLRLVRGKRQEVLSPKGKILSFEPSTQVGMSDVEKEKAEKKKGKEVGEDGVPKHQKYYQYDYFKEW